MSGKVPNHDKSNMNGPWLEPSSSSTLLRGSVPCRTREGSKSVLELGGWLLRKPERKELSFC